MSDTWIKKQNKIKNLFLQCANEDEKYKLIIEMGKKLPKMNPEYKTEENIVKGCQSIMYLRSYLQGDKVMFEVGSDALISAGLAAILVEVYSGETAETILKNPPNFLEELGISASLTPSRANGLYSVHLKMKQEALKIYIESQRK